MWLYALAIFLGAFLLFQVQPIIARHILPWFGGTPGVWTTCMLFFQVVLLGGYAYAHVLRGRLGPRSQALVHAGVLLVAALALPIAPSASWKPAGDGDPTWAIVALLAASVGLPYFALAATSPLLQAWATATHTPASPYRLYAVSNAGSLLALVTYPLLVERALGLGGQTAVWSAGFVAFAVACVVCAIRAGGAAGAGGARTSAASPRPRPAVRLLWFALPACGSALLLAVTNQMCADVAVVPLLWVLPLGLYLLSYALCFHSVRCYWRAVFWPLMGAAAAGMAWLIHQEVDSPILLQVLGFSGGLFIACMVCHGELARLKPAPDRLTSYYLTMAAGGAAGGVLVAVAAPLVLRTYLELPLAIWASAALAVLAFWHEQPAGQRWRQRWAGPLFAAEGLAALGLLAFVLKEAAPSLVGDALPPTRNFYGVLRVTAYNEDDPDCARYCLRHGRICHGTQFTSEERRRRPTSYYGESSGVGLALVALQDRPDLRVGVVGLGVGTLAAYGRPGDTYRFYEINPAVRHLATSLFTYLGDSAARCEVAMGDARLSLEREPPQRFDLLALDAFTSDAIPVHLLTREAFEVYFRHLRPGGVLAVHVSNRYLDLEPVILALAAHFQRAAVVIESKEDAENEIDPATWVLVTDDRALLDAEPIQNAASGQTYRTGPRYLWTDNYSNLLSVLH